MTKIQSQNGPCLFSLQPLSKSQLKFDHRLDMGHFDYNPYLNYTQKLVASWIMFVLVMTLV